MLLATHIEAHWQAAHLLLSALPRLITPNLNALQYGTTNYILYGMLFVVNHIASDLSSHKKDSILDSARSFFQVLMGPRFRLHYKTKNPGCLVQGPCR